MFPLRSSKIGLGSAQWGMNYGIKNIDGKPHVSEVKQILELAQNHGIDLLDTAASYGESEHVLGTLVQQTSSFRIVTKTSPIRKARLSKSDVDSVVASFRNSLKKLRREKVYGLLVHHSQDILNDDGDRLWESLQELKSSSLLDKLGVSVYDPGELEEILRRYHIDIVQLPLNIYDQRFLKSGALRTLKKLEIEVHVRSVFLQGLLLIEAEKLPDQFHSIKFLQKQLHSFIRASGCCPTDACLKFCLAQEDIDFTIVGFETLVQFQQIVMAAQTGRFDATVFHHYDVEDEKIINPSRWSV